MPYTHAYFKSRLHFLELVTFMEIPVHRPHAFLFFLCSATLLLMFWPFLHPRLQQLPAKLLQLNAIPTGPQLSSSEGSEPLIFLYNSFFSSANWNTNWDSVNGSTDLKTLTDCPMKCQFTSSPPLLESADLVLVSLAYYNSYGGKPVNIKYFKGNQIWAGFQLESPVHGGGYEYVDGIFDWVATYRRDSDISVRYGRVYPVTAAQPDVPLRSIGKTLRHKKLAAWLVSNCNPRSERGMLVETLQRYIPVDVFGACSKRTCPETKELSCRNYLGQNYKFYLAFENSLCIDYVTEKFFLSYQYDMVPVTFGLADYSLYGPPGSYINALDYDSVGDLAEYLAFLDQNDEEYLKYFSWRGEYQVESFTMINATCTVCRTLSDYMKRRVENGTGTRSPEQTGLVKTYPSFRKWYESFPAPQTSALHHVGKNITLSATQACLDPGKYPVLQKWIRGG